MKKLNKLQIKSEKLIKNEEMISLRGGYGGNGTGCCTCHQWGGSVLGFIAGSTPGNCNNDCFNHFSTGYGTWDCTV